MANYVEFNPHSPRPPECNYREITVRCGPKEMVAAPDALYRNRGDGTLPKCLPIQFRRHARPIGPRFGTQGNNPGPENVQGSVLVPVHPESAGYTSVPFASPGPVPGPAPVAVLRRVLRVHFDHWHTSSGTPTSPMNSGKRSKSIARRSGLSKFG